MKRKKTEKVGTISGIDLIKKTKPRQNIPFRTGRHMSVKDRPRKKYSKRDAEEICND